MKKFSCEKITKRETADANAAIVQRSTSSVAVKDRKTGYMTDAPVFIPKDTKRHILKNYSLSHIRTLYQYANVNWPSSWFKRETCKIIKRRR